VSYISGASCSIVVRWLRVVGTLEAMSQSQLSNEFSLSQATITVIIALLTARKLVSRERSSSDRRVVTVRITDEGMSLVKAAPSPLQERFVAQLGELSNEEREIIRLTLNKIVRMMGGESIDAAPLLTNESVIAGPQDADRDSAQPQPPSGKSSPRS